MVVGRLGLLADTHLSLGSQRLPPMLLKVFGGVEAILHGGDVVDLECLTSLTDIAPVYVVAGNNDPESIGVRCGWRRALRWRGWRIGLVHGDQRPGRTTPDRARNAFRLTPPMFETVAFQESLPPTLPDTHVPVPCGRPVEAHLDGPGPGPLDCIVFGHSHIPICRVQDAILMVNPGSPTDRRREPRTSCAVLEAHDDGVLQARMLYL